MCGDASQELLPFRSAVTDVRLQPDPVVVRWLTRDLTKYAEYATELDLDPEFVRTMCGLVVEAFRRLDALPRTDAFWEGTNRRPVPRRLSAFCEKLLNDRPGDPQALWMRAAVESVIAGPCFIPHHWVQLLSVARADVAWPITSAVYGELMGGNDTVPSLVGFLAEEGLGREALPELARMSQRARDPYLRGWAGRVIDGLRQIVHQRNS